MGRCDIEIAFDRADRTYRGGEDVTGQVTVTVNEDTRCNGILLTYYWKTHGRGNTASGEKHKVVLSETIPLQAGSVLQFPFQFTADVWPLTYHGNYIFLDHYVHVAVDVPWAIDPRYEEEFLLIAGQVPSEFLGGRSEIADFSQPAKEASGIVRFILFGVVGILLLVFSAFLLFLLPVLILVGAGYLIWKKMITSRVGEVLLQTPHRVICPGEHWPVHLCFTPRKSFQINGITLCIAAQEVAVSGSGTDQTTHRNTLCEETHTLVPAGMLMAGEQLNEDFSILLPETEAWSFKESSNRIDWRAEIRIDMPGFPDWSQKVELQMIPEVFLTPGPELERRDPHRPALVDDPMSSSTSLDDEFSSSTVDEQSGRYIQSENAGSLLSLLDHVLEAGRYGNERSQIVAAAAGHRYDLVISVERVSSTLGFSGTDSRYERGRTITGHIAGTKRAVQLFTLEDSNESLRGVVRGDIWQTTVVVSEWDSLYDRLIVHEFPSDRTSR